MNRNVLDEGEAALPAQAQRPRGEADDLGQGEKDDGDPPNLVPEAEPRNILAGRIELLEKIGEGGMGAVYRGHHLKLGRAVAVKVLDETLQLRAWA